MPIDPMMGFQTPTTQAPSFWNRVQSGLFGPSQSYGGLLSPEDEAAARRQGLMALSSQLLSASGPSRMPTSLGSALGQGMMAAQQAQKQSIDDRLQAMLVATQLQKRAEPARHIVGNTMVDDNGKVIYQQPSVVEAPKSRQVEMGGKTITQEWDAANQKWNNVGEAPRWQPTQPEKPESPPSGYRWNAARTGLEIIPGGPADPSIKPKDAPKPTEADKKASVLIQGMEDAEKELAQAGQKTDPTGKWNAAMGHVPFTGETLQTDEYRRYQATAGRWAANYLYLKSGAQASKDEITNVMKQFFPQPGDDDDTVALKARARQQEMAGARAGYQNSVVNFGKGSNDLVGSLLDKYAPR
jgi:hypothetical protein